MSEHHQQALPTGHRIAEYEIVRVLGVGGFGITYLAFDHNLNGPVAIKEYFYAGLTARMSGGAVKPNATSNGDGFQWGRDRFLDEAQVLSRLDHPNIVRVHRYFEQNNTAYIVMEYVEGESLAAFLKAHGTLAPDQWRPWMEALLDGLEHVHAQGYLHRDITPANIVIRAANGEPVLIDFGSARMAAGERTHTQVLTPAYAPIEQHTSEARQGPFTDIYSLAAVSYRALTGELPPSAPDRMLDDRYEPLAERVAATEHAWLAAIDRGLALRPDDRPQTVAAWQAAATNANTTTVRIDEKLTIEVIQPPRRHVATSTNNKAMNDMEWRPSGWLLATTLGLVLIPLILLVPMSSFLVVSSWLVCMVSFMRAFPEIAFDTLKGLCGLGRHRPLFLAISLIGQSAVILSVLAEADPEDFLAAVLFGYIGALAVHFGGGNVFVSVAPLLPPLVTRLWTRLRQGGLE